jgi:hypothetical protein
VLVGCLVLAGCGGGKSGSHQPDPVPSRPNLLVLAVEAPEVAAAGEVFHVRMLMRNDGDAVDTAYKIWFPDAGDEPGGTQSSPGVEMGPTRLIGRSEPKHFDADSEQWFEAWVRAPSAGSFSITFTADSGDQVAEEDEADNVVVRIVTVAAPG